MDNTEPLLIMRWRWKEAEEMPTWLFGHPVRGIPPSLTPFGRTPPSLYDTRNGFFEPFTVNGCDSFVACLGSPLKNEDFKSCILPSMSEGKKPSSSNTIMRFAPPDIIKNRVDNNNPLSIREIT
jgi:hypothetical protein